MTDLELDEILIGRWPALVRHAMIDGDEWTRSFAKSIAHQRKRESRRPATHRYSAIAGTLQEMAQHEPDPGNLIEDERGHGAA